MTCAACAQTVQNSISKLDGVTQCSVNYASNDATIEFNTDVVSLEDIRKAIVSVGYDAVITSNAQEKGEEVEKQKTQFRKNLITDLIVAGIFSIPLFIISMFFMNMKSANLIMAILATPVVFYSGRRFFISAAKKLVKFSSTMDTLVAVSTGIAYIFSVVQLIAPHIISGTTGNHHVYFESSAVVIFFVLLGKFLEEQAKSNSANAIRELVASQPTTASVMNDKGEFITINISSILQGQKIMIKPGEKIPVDGTVISGESYVNESTITGESHPHSKRTGSLVYAGSINQSGSMVVSALRTGADTILARMIEKVKQAQSSKPPIQHLADKISSWFVPAIILIAIATFFTWLFAIPVTGFYLGIYNFVSVLVIACPCALGLATPTAIMVGINIASKKGVLIKDAVSLEKSTNINAIVLDKTGTLTMGNPVVVDEIWNKNYSTPTHPSILEAIESRSEHPLAKAISNHYKNNVDKKILIGGFKNVPGNGVSAMFNRELFEAGKISWITRNPIAIPDEMTLFLKQKEKEAATLVGFTDGKELIAILCLADELNQHAIKVLDELRNKRVEIYMLTGDNNATAKFIAAKCRIQHYHSGMLPSDKSAYIKKLQQEGKVVAMVGDGVNDAEALAVANVSFAMGKGTDVAMDVAQVTLMRNDLRLIPTTIHISRKTMRTMYQNLFWAFIYNLICIPIAAGVLYPINGFLLNPMIAGAAMALSSVSVVTNSLLLRKKISV